MPPIHLSLRGEIGIRKGLGLEQVEVDYSKLTPGIVAITGETGRGKTTIADNSHHFRKLVFRKKNIADQFYLRDSHKIFRSIYNGDEFESRLLIDGVTSASEAYLYCNNNPKPLNDGKVSTYDDAVEEIFGSFNIYSKSAYSKQVVANPFSKEKGMSMDDLRMLFYEICNINKYPIWFKHFQKSQQENEEKYRLAEEQIKVWREQIDAITITEKDVEETLSLKVLRMKIIEDLESLIKNTGRQKQNKEIELSGLKKQLTENEETKTKIGVLTLEVANTEQQKNDTTQLYETQKIEQLAEFENNDPHAKKLSELNGQKQTAAEKAEIDKTQAVNEKTELEKKISTTNTQLETEDAIIKRNEKLIANVTTIDERITKKKELTEELGKIMLEERVLVDEKSKLQAGEKTESETLKELETRLTNLKAIGAEIRSNIDNLDKEERRTIKNHEDKVSEITAETAIIAETPCDDSLPPICPAIKNIVAKKNSLSDLEEEYNKGLDRIRKEKNMLAVSMFENDEEIETANAEVITKKEFISQNYTNKYTEIESKIETFVPKIKDLTGQLAEINKSDWEKLRTEATNADNAINIANNTKNSLSNLLAEYDKQLNEKEILISNIQLNLSDKLQTIGQQIVSESNLSKDAKDRIEKEWAQKIQNEEDRAAERIQSISKQIEELNLKVKSELPELIKKLDEAISAFEKEITEAENLLKKTQLELNEFEGKIGEMRQRISLKSVNQDNIKMKEGELRFYEREIKEYSLLAAGFDKTGIPVLKIDNSGPEVSAIANELLAVADFPFKIRLSTTEQTKKGSLKEVFKISIIENDFEIFGKKADPDLDLKSGGQQSWISSGIQLAITSMSKNQGKNIDTLFLDEHDGNLDGALAYKYFQMLQKVKELINVDYIYAITHRPEIIETISQRIELHDGYIQIVNDAA